MDPWAHGLGVEVFDDESAAGPSAVGDVLWVLQELAQGRPVRRQGWPARRYLTLTNRKRLFVHGQYDEHEQVALQDLKADDWEPHLIVCECERGGALRPRPEVW